MMDCVLSGSLLVVFSLFCYAMCVFFLEQMNSLSLSLSGKQSIAGGPHESGTLVCSVLL